MNTPYHQTDSMESLSTIRVFFIQIAALSVRYPRDSKSETQS